MIKAQIPINNIYCSLCKRFGKDFEHGILCPQLSKIPPYESLQVTKLKEEEGFDNFSQNTVQYPEVPDLQSRLVKVENQAALYGTS